MFIKIQNHWTQVNCMKDSVTQKLFHCARVTMALLPSLLPRHVNGILAKGVEATERLTSFEHSGTMYMCLSVN